MHRPTHRQRFARALVPVLTLALLVGASPVGASPVGASPVGATPVGAPRSATAATTPDEILVRYREGTSEATRRDIARVNGLTRVLRQRAGDARGPTTTPAAETPATPLPRTELLRSTGRSLATLRRLLGADPNVIAVAANGRNVLAVDPPAPGDPSDEPFYDDLWGLDNTGQTIDGTTLQAGTPGVDIDGRQAFAHETGDPDLIVAVIDDGIDFSHPDLVDRAWTNPGESGAGRETNGWDDDGNGFVDDVNGWDFCNPGPDGKGDNTVHDPGEDGHGTHVAGTIAASRNGVGTVGVAPTVQLMALKFIDNGRLCGTDGMAIDAIDYAASFGVHLINASWGGPTANSVLEAAIAESGALVIAAAGNYGENLDGDGPDPDTTPDPPFYPASFTLVNVIAVTAIDQKGKLAGFSNYGAISVDIAAPGTNILSTYPEFAGCATPCYVFSDGTSMAAPHVTGVAALIGSRSGAVLADPLALRARLLGTGTKLASTTGLTVTGRLANAYRAVDPTPPVALPVDRHRINSGTVISSTAVSTSMTWPAATDDLSGVASYWLMRSAAGGGWGTITSTTTARSAKRDLIFGTEYRFRIRARDRAGNIGAAVDGPVVKASLVQEATPLATYAGTWTTTRNRSASAGKFRTSTTAGSSVTFRFTGRAIGIVAPKGPTRASVNVYVDGAYVSTVSLYRGSTLSRVVVYATSWATTGRHTVKLVTKSSSGRTRVDIDAAAILR